MFLRPICQRLFTSETCCGATVRADTRENDGPYSSHQNAGQDSQSHPPQPTAPRKEDRGSQRLRKGFHTSHADRKGTSERPLFFLGNSHTRPCSAERGTVLRQRCPCRRTMRDSMVLPSWLKKKRKLFMGMAVPSQGLQTALPLHLSVLWPWNV